MAVLSLEAPEVDPSLRSVACQCLIPVGLPLGVAGILCLCVHLSPLLYLYQLFKIDLIQHDYIELPLYMYHSF